MSETKPSFDEARHGLLVRIAFEAVWERDLRSEEVHWDASIESIFGYPRSEVRNSVTWWRERVHPDDIEKVEQIMAGAIRDSAAGWSNEYRFRRRDGSWAWVSSRCVIERDASGQARRAVGVMMDISCLKETEMRLRQVLDTLPVGVLVLNQSGDVLLSNPASSRIWAATIVSGRERWSRSKGFWHASRKEIAAEEWASRRALEDGQISRDELIDIEAFDGKRKTIENFAAPIRNFGGEITGAVVVNEDVTERVRAEDALRKTERLLVEAEQLGQTGSWEQDLVSGELFNTEANRRLFFGDDLSKGEQLEAEDYVAAVHPDDRERVMAARRQLHAGAGRRDIEFRVVRPDGDVRWIFGRATIVRDAAGRPLRAYGTHADITERKHAQEELGRRTQQLEALSRKLIEAQEAERRAVARELHDDFGQVLTAIKINLRRTAPDDTENAALVDAAIVRMRELAQGLRPPLLDQFGLEASLRWYVEREAKRTGFAFELDFAPLDRRAGTVVETTCFRVAQEALTNVIRHADAHLVKIELSVTNGDLQLSLCDDGRGFDVAAARKRSNQDGNQGLLNMQERVALVGGDFEIESAPGRGTCVRARLPLAAARKK